MTTTQTLFYVLLSCCFPFYSHRRPPATSTRRGSSPLLSLTRSSISVCVHVCVCLKAEDDHRRGHCSGTPRKRPHLLCLTLRKNSLSSADHLPPDLWAEPNTQNTRGLNGLQFVGRSIFKEPCLCVPVFLQI